MEDRNGEFDVTKVSGTLGHTLVAGSTLERAIDRAQMGIVEPALSRFLTLVVLNGKEYGVSAGFGVVDRTMMRPCLLTIVSGYSMCCTLICLISSGESKPN